MAVLFVSHSNKEDAAATALEAWLRGNGFTDIFVDHHSIAGGDKWRDALRVFFGAVPPAETAELTGLVVSLAAGRASENRLEENLQAA